MDRKRFAITMNLLFELYDKNASEGLLNIYYEILSKVMTIEQFEYAIRKLVETRKYSSIPKPAEIIECCNGSEEDRALLAWHRVFDAIIKIGLYRTVEFEDKTIHMCIEAMGGWVKIASHDKKETPFIQKEFIRLYTMQEKFPRQTSNKLLGMHEQRNREAGIKVDKCVFVGNEKQKKELTQNINNK